MALRQSQSGMTLLETILALAIGASVLLLSIKMYQSYELDVNVAQLEYNVDNLFQAMSLYYKANCGVSYSNTGAMSTFGSLNPDKNNPSPPSLTQPFVITIAANLQGANMYLKSWQPLNPLVNVAGGAEKGYFVQFDPILFNTNNVNALSSMTVLGAPQYTINGGTGNLTSSLAPANIVASPYTYGPTPVNPTTQQNGHYMPANQSEGLVWKLQVSVLLLDPTKAADYQAMMNANCNSDLVGSGVEPCEKPPAASKGYLVWERLPSNAAPNISTTNANWMPSMSQFNLQYTHDQMYEMIPGTKDQGGNSLRYYLCGG